MQRGRCCLGQVSYVGLSWQGLLLETIANVAVRLNDMLEPVPVLARGEQVGWRGARDEEKAWSMGEVEMREARAGPWRIFLLCLCGSSLLYQAGAKP